MGNIYDIFILNVLWLLCCLPIITIGPATTAFFYAMIQLVRGADSAPSKDFFHSFRQNFRQGITLGLPLTVIGVFLVIDISMCHRAGTGIYTFFMVFFFTLFLLWGFITLYSFPLLAKFDKRNKEILSWAFVLSMRHVGQTFLMLLVLAVGLWACHILHGLIFIVFGLVGEFQATLIAVILKPYLPNMQRKDEQESLALNTADKDGDYHA